MPDRHRTLARQLRREGLSDTDPRWASFLDRVDRFYRSADRDRYLLERSIELSSQEMERLHDRVRKERDQLDATLSALQEGVCALDGAGVVRVANALAVRALGGDEDQVVGRPFSELASLWAGAVELDPCTPTSGRIDDAELRTHDATMPCTLAINSIGGTGGVVVAFHDTTVRKRRQQELEEARIRAAVAARSERAKSDFLASMSHELRTPLNAIIGYSEMLADEMATLDPHQAEADLRRIHAAGRHLLALINDILDLSKIEAGKVELYFETVSASELVQDAALHIRPLATQRGNHVELDIHPGAGLLRTDATKLRQCLINLAGNAAKFTEGGTIRIEVTPTRGDALEFAVQDNGIGVPQAQLQRLFDAFVQADGSTTRRYGGTGLGLTITKRFTELLGGTISAESEVGHGTRFAITLPRGIAEERAHEDQPTILVVDDDPVTHDLMRRVLARDGYAIRSAYTCAEALELARTGPAAITLDILLPDGSGLDVLRELQQTPELCDIPVVMVSVVNEPGQVQALGALEHVAKPLDRGRLLSAVRRACGSAGTVLVVEDDRDARELSRRILTDAGYGVVEAHNGVQALRAVDRSAPDAVLLDLMMPELDGFGFLGALRAKPEHDGLPVVVLTAMALTDDHHERLRRMVSAVVHKGDAAGADIVKHVASALERVAVGG